MISATVCYLIAGVFFSIIYTIFLIADKNFPASLMVCSTLCSVICTLIVTGILYLVEKSYPTGAWIVAGVLLLLQLLSMIFGKTTVTKIVKGEVKTYTS